MNNVKFDSSKPIQSAKATRDFFECSHSFLYHNLIKNGHLHQVRIGRKVYFRTSEILHLAESQIQSA